MDQTIARGGNTDMHACHVTYARKQFTEILNYGVSGACWCCICISWLVFGVVCMVGRGRAGG